MYLPMYSRCTIFWKWLLQMEYFNKICWFSLHTLFKDETFKLRCMYYIDPEVSVCIISWIHKLYIAWFKFQWDLHFYKRRCRFHTEFGKILEIYSDMSESVKIKIFIQNQKNPFNLFWSLVGLILIFSHTCTCTFLHFLHL